MTTELQHTQGFIIQQQPSQWIDPISVTDQSFEEAQDEYQGLSQYNPETAHALIITFTTAGPILKDFDQV